MTKDDLDFFKKWFTDYCGSFYTSDIEDRKNIGLKERHTFKVCENIIRISQELSLGEDRMLLAEAIALFHDIGRFPQYAKYKTFRDSISVNHGLLGAETLREKNVLRELSLDEREVIIRSVMFHNAFSLPGKEREEIVFYIRLIRDADKLDIWRVFLDHYESPAKDRASAVGLGLPEAPGYSEQVLSNLYRKRIVSLSTVRTLDDFKLLQLSWVFDLNFVPSYFLVAERNYMERIIAHLPQTEAIQNLLRYLQEFVKSRMISP